MSSAAPDAPPTPESPVPPARRPTFRARLSALGVIATSMLMIVLDGSIVTVAMPAIQDDLGFSPAGLSWVVNAYLIAFGSLLLLAGRLGDLIGRKPMFLSGILLFTAASLVAAAAGSPAVLIAARFAQGVGSAMSAAVALGILVTLFTEPAERARAIAVFSFTGAAGASIGQVLGGVLTDALTWHWIFFINLPIGLAVLLVAVRVLPADRGRGLAAGADVAGALLVTAGLMLGIYTVVGVETYGWVSAHTLGLGALALALLAGFVLRQATAPTPLMPLRILRSRNVSGANVVQMLMVAALFSFQIIVALYLQKVLGYGAAATGLAIASGRRRHRGRPRSASRPGSWPASAIGPYCLTESATESPPYASSTGIDLRVGHGSVFALLGPNGAGKTSSPYGSSPRSPPPTRAPPGSRGTTSSPGGARCAGRSASPASSPPSTRRRPARRTCG
ncbi:Putative multidrug resistance protein MdtD [Streptomyces microflavus]